MRKDKANSSRIARKGFSLAEKFPNLLLDWDYEKNQGINPEIISATSRLPVWWKRKECGHTWFACVGDNSKRANGGILCPVCFDEYILSHRAKDGKKICTKCEKEKNITSFYKREILADGFDSMCKECSYNLVYKPANIETMLRRILSTKKGNAKKKKKPIPVEISFEWFKKRFFAIEGKCEISGIEFDLYGRNNPRGCLGPLSLSFDRINPNLPYTEENTRLILACLNSFIGTMNDTEAFSLLDRISAGINQKARRQVNP